MAKKFLTPSDQSEEFTFIAISSHLKDYKITFHINNALGTHLKRIHDLVQEKAGETYNYSFFHDYNADQRYSICLISNHHPDSKLLASLKQTDYFLVAKDLNDESTVAEIIKTLRNIPGILTAYKINIEKERQVQVLLNDVEIHLMKALK